MMISLKTPYLLRCFDFLVTATYAKYASFLGNLAPCIWDILSGITEAGTYRNSWNGLTHD